MRFVKYTLAILLAGILLLSLVYYLQVRLPVPALSEHSAIYELYENQAGEKTYGPNLLRQNEKGLWEMYLEGSPIELGDAMGVLAKSLQEEKEAAFIGEIQKRIPSKFYLNFLKILVGWFNRSLDEHVPQEFLQEIYASSQQMSDHYDFVGPKYHRALSYHAAHDIGHALQNMNLVGCTAFAAWGESSKEGKLLVGRNFDFYFGKEFSKDKIIAFYKPDSGYQFMSVTWAGFSGVVSGMNEQGLSVSLNSAKSAVPTRGTMPVSLIARHILQYAATIEEAYAIAKSYESFVAETFLIGSKNDGRAGLIEKTPQETHLHLPEENKLIVTNHFQGDELLHNKENQEYMAEGVSDYRYARVAQLMDDMAPLQVSDFTSMLRDKQGVDGADIGLGNEKAINQLLAHHGIVFSPNDLMVWVSASPYVLGDFVAYDLDKIFNGDTLATTIRPGFVADKTIAADPFVNTHGFEKFEKHAEIRDRLQHYLLAGKGKALSDDEIQDFIQGNPDGYLTYLYLGEYYKKAQAWEKAIHYYDIGLQKEIARSSERKQMEEGRDYCLTKKK